MDERISRGLLLFAFITAAACDVSESTPDGGSGGKSGAGGASHGGSSSSGASSGGATSSGGAANGGTTSATQNGGASGSVSGGATSSGGSNAGGVTGMGGASAGMSAGGSSAGANTASGGSTVGGGTSACAGALFCEDFEQYASGQAFTGALSTTTNQGTVAIDTTQHYSGSKSVKFTTMASSNTKTAYLSVKGSSVFPVDGNMFYGRMMFYLQSAPTTSVHWTFVQGYGTVVGQTYHADYRYGGQMPVNGGSQMMANYDTPDSYNNMGPKSDCWRHSNARLVPVAKWSCLEWQFDGSKNQMHLWLDGTAADDLTIDGKGDGCVNQDASYTWAAPNFERLDVGWESYQQDDARTLYIDDLAISKTRINCPAKQ